MSALLDVQAMLADLAAQGVQPRRLINDSRLVAPGDVFIAYPGLHADGRQFIAAAVQRGASAVLWEASGFAWDAAWQVANIGITGLREVAGEIAHQVYGRPSEKMRLIGITGTNGKTSCSHWLARALSAAGQSCALIGTIGNGFPDDLHDTLNTTPDAVSLHALLADYQAAGAVACAMEVSSIGIEQNRCAGAAFAVAVFTNLTRDHLDYHRTMDAYAAAKKQLFVWPGLQAAVINLDDPQGRRLAASSTAVRKIGYTLHGADSGRVEYLLRAEKIIALAEGQRFTLLSPEGEVEIHTPMLGTYNIANLLAVAGSLLALDVPFARLGELLGALQPPPGRMEQLGGAANEPLVVVDYAHTPDALDNALAALRVTAATRGGRLYCIFGCGGDRDRGKRPQMGEIAGRRADQVVLTNDNPRNEDPAGILAEIAAAVPTASIVADRAQAIATTITAATPADVILIAGKGHEPYQEIAGERHHFSDVAEAGKALASRREAAA